MADRYNDSYWPHVQRCPHCGMTARPVHHDPQPPDKVFCPLCGASVPFETIKPTRYDQIQRMSLEELADLLGMNSLCEHIQYAHPEWCEKQSVCDTCLTDWLQSPAEDEYV